MPEVVRVAVRAESQLLRDLLTRFVTGPGVEVSPDAPPVVSVVTPSMADGAPGRVVIVLDGQLGEPTVTVDGHPVRVAHTPPEALHQLIIDLIHGAPTPALAPERGPTKKAPPCTPPGAESPE